MKIPEQPTWSIIDSSKLDTYQSCPRKYFYEYILGWRLDMPAHDLFFGTCWHLAREHQLIYGYDDVVGAYNKFITEYRTQFDPETDALYRPKDPTAVLNALNIFAEQKRLDLIENSVVELDGLKMTEIAGKVPISEGRYLHYRMDSIIQRNADGKILSWDHKTTSGKYINNRQWADQFLLSIQNGTYTHCLYMMFPIDQVLGMEFCGCGFEYLSRGSAARPAGYHATLRRVQAFKTPSQMNVWLWNVNDLYSDLMRDMDRLSSCSESDAVLHAFQQHPKSCTDYRGCPYYDYCLSWTNPLRSIDEPPLGFKVEFWDPSAIESSVRKDLEWR